jgi:hypothetical protein
MLKKAGWMSAGLVALSTLAAVSLSAAPAEAAVVYCKTVRATYPVVRPVVPVVRPIYRPVAATGVRVTHVGYTRVTPVGVRHVGYTRVRR